MTCRRWVEHRGSPSEEEVHRGVGELHSGSIVTCRSFFSTTENTEITERGRGWLKGSVDTSRAPFPRRRVPEELVLSMNLCVPPAQDTSPLYCCASTVRKRGTTNSAYTTYPGQRQSLREQSVGTCRTPSPTIHSTPLSPASPGREPAWKACTKHTRAFLMALLPTSQ